MVEEEQAPPAKEGIRMPQGGDLDLGQWGMGNDASALARRACPVARVEVLGALERVHVRGRSASHGPSVGARPQRAKPFSTHASSATQVVFSGVEMTTHVALDGALAGLDERAGCCGSRLREAA